ncbi:MAG TPA: hypothetical protein VGD78_09895 [Chthoniobacterales bacterium]
MHPLLTHAFRYGNGKVTDLFKDNFSVATGINCLGEIVGYYSRATSEVYGDENPAYPYYAFVHGGRGSRFDTLGTLPGGTSPYATGLNDSGEVVGYADVRGQARAFLYDHGRMMDLGMLPGDTDSEAFAINLQGDLIGNCSSGNPDAGTAFFYHRGNMQDLNALIPSDSG